METCTEVFGNPTLWKSYTYPSSKLSDQPFFISMFSSCFCCLNLKASCHRQVIVARSVWICQIWLSWQNEAVHHLTETCLSWILVNPKQFYSRKDRYVVFSIFNRSEVLPSVSDKENLFAEIFSQKSWLNFLFNLDCSGSFLCFYFFTPEIMLVITFLIYW